MNAPMVAPACPTPWPPPHIVGQGSRTSTTPHVLSPFAGPLLASPSVFRAALHSPCPTMWGGGRGWGHRRTTRSPHAETAAAPATAAAATEVAR